VNAWHHAPPLGSRSGVADYAAALDKQLVGDYTPLYHVGNNGLHREIYSAALARPGVIVLHDAVLHHFFLGTLRRDEYITEFTFNYGEWRRDLAADLWTHRAASGTDPRYFEFPMLRRLVETAKAVIVHNRGAESLARDHGATNVHVIPHFHEPPRTEAVDGVFFRERLNIAPGTTLFGIFGYLRETKRILPSIRAFTRLHAVRPDTALLIAGEPVSDDLRRLIDSEAARPGIIRLGHLTESELSAAATAIDCCINPRWPGAGETSGIAIRMMGVGKPVILTESPEIEDFPEGSRLVVRPGATEIDDLFAQMALVTDFPALAREMGMAARRHIESNHQLSEVARCYREVLLSAG
jgi:glycosyltransferase involved in cell wall biosynthesis